MPLTADKYAEYLPIARGKVRPEGLSDEALAALQQEVQAYEDQMLKQVGQTRAPDARPATGSLGVQGVLGAPRRHGIEPLGQEARALEQQLNPDLPVPAQALSLSPATTHPGGDEAAKNEWYRQPGGDPAGGVVFYEMPLDIARKKLLEHPELFAALGYENYIPTGEEILAMDTNDPKYQALNDLEWRQAAEEAAKAGKTAYRYSKSPWLHGDGMMSPLAALGMKLQTSIEPAVEGLRAMVLGVDKYATLGAGRLYVEGVDKARRWAGEQLGVPDESEGPEADAFGNEVVGGQAATRAAGGDARAENESLIEDNPLKYRLGEGLAMLAPWAPANRAWNVVTSGGQALATRVAPRVAGNWLGRTGVSALAAGTAGGLLHLGQEGLEAAGNYAATGELGTTGEGALDRAGQAAAGAAVLGGGLQLIGRGAAAEAEWTRSPEGRYGGAPERIEQAGGRFAFGRGPVAPAEYVEAQKKARALGIGNNPEQVIAGELTPTMTAGARKVHADARLSVAREKADFHPTPEGQEELPVPNLLTEAVSVLDRHYSRKGPDGLTTVGVPKAGDNARVVFNKNIERVSREPVEGAIELTVEQAEAYLSPELKRTLIPKRAPRQAQSSSGAREIDPDAPEAAAEAAGETLASHGVDKVYVVPRRYGAKHMDQAITNVDNRGRGTSERPADRDMELLRDALYVDRQARKMNGVPGGWSAKRAEQQERIAKARDTRERVLPKSAETGAKQNAHKVLVDYARTNDLPTIQAVRDVATRQGVLPQVEQLRLADSFGEMKRRVNFGRSRNGTLPNVADAGSVWGRGFDAANLRFFYPTASFAERQLNPVGAFGQFGMLDAGIIGADDPGDIRRRAAEESGLQAAAEKRAAEKARRDEERKQTTKPRPASRRRR